MAPEHESSFDSRSSPIQLRTWAIVAHPDPELLKSLRHIPDKANVVTPEGHANDDLDELIVDIDILIAEELDLTHRFGGHHRPVEGCERCGRVPAVPQAPGSYTTRGAHSAER